MVPSFIRTNSFFDSSASNSEFCQWSSSFFYVYWHLWESPQTYQCVNFIIIITIITSNTSKSINSINILSALSVPMRLPPHWTQPLSALTSVIFFPSQFPKLVELQFLPKMSVREVMHSWKTLPFLILPFSQMRSLCPNISIKFDK